MFETLVVLTFNFSDAVNVYPCTFTINVTNNDTIIRSPGFPFSYGQGLNCTWNIYTKYSVFVKLEITHVQLAKTTTEIALKEVFYKSSDYSSR